MSDIRLQTSLIIRKGNEYLVGRCLLTGQLIWRTSKWEAWRTRIIASAKGVAEKTGGEIYLFNPIVGQIRKFGG